MDVDDTPAPEDTGTTGRPRAVMPSAPAPLAERIGIMQGRLVASATGELQCSPGSRWPEEFSIAATIGLHHIELLAERVPDSANPIWSPDGRRALRAVVHASGVSVASLCMNEPLEVAIDDADFALDLANRLSPVLDELDVRVVVLPLFEASDLGALDWSLAARSVQLLADRFHGVGGHLALELGVSAADSLRFLSATGSRVRLCYDVGNATALGFNAADELRVLGQHVRHLHAKDKDAAQENVRFGTGEVPFAAVLTALADLDFDGLVTMEATRGEDPIVTAAEHRAFLLAMEAPGRAP